MNNQFWSLGQLPGGPASEDALTHLWPLVQGVMALNADALQSIHTRPHSLIAALSVVFIAGLAQSLSQFVVLFINQVRPLRFVLSLIISALFFVIGYGFWALSIWAIINLTFDIQLPLVEVLRTLGFSYAPLMLSVFVIFPYFGNAVFVLLSIWTLLAVVVGIDSITALGRWDAFESAALGWVTIQLLQKTVGQPIASLGQWINNWAAGEELITNRTRLAQELYAGLRFSLEEAPPAQGVANTVDSLPGIRPKPVPKPISETNLKTKPQTKPQTNPKL